MGHDGVVFLDRSRRSKIDDAEEERNDSERCSLAIPSILSVRKLLDIPLLVIRRPRRIIEITRKKLLDAHAKTRGTNNRVTTRTQSQDD